MFYLRANSEYRVLTSSLIFTKNRKMKICDPFILLLAVVLLLSLSHSHVAAIYDHESHEQPKETCIIHMDKPLKPAVFGHHSN